MHPRNRHTARYDFERLVMSSPELASFASKNPSGEPTIDFADPRAVQSLNRALLKTYYGVSSWGIPAGYLSPPVPGRADYLHHAADLLARAGAIPRGDSVRVLDIGVGASCIYPIIGRAEYGWRFTGSDVDRAALASAQRIVESNPSLAGGVDLRLQASSSKILSGIINSGESFDLVICNPPFHASLEAAREAGRVKRAKLGLSPDGESNFGGAENELWCAGGEEAFVRRMIAESKEFASSVGWFTALISKSSTLPAIEKALIKAGAVERRVIDMAQGQKKSRFAAWTFRKT